MRLIDAYAFKYRRLSIEIQISWQPFGVRLRRFHTRNLVDPASSHMLVSRTKPCKSQSKWITVGLQTAH